MDTISCVLTWIGNGGEVIQQRDAGRGSHREASIAEAPYKSNFQPRWKLPPPFKRLAWRGLPLLLLLADFSRNYSRPLDIVKNARGDAYPVARADPTIGREAEHGTQWQSCVPRSGCRGPLRYRPQV